MEMQHSDIGYSDISAGVWEHITHYHNFVQVCKRKSSGIWECLMQVTEDMVAFFVYMFCPAQRLHTDQRSNSI